MMRIGSAITFIAIGLILAIAVDIDPTPMAGLTIRWDSVGVILILVGLIGLAWSVWAMQTARRTYVEPVEPVVPQDRIVTERETWVER